jgi:hypothetical protein
VVKQLSEFRTFFQARCLETEISPKKFPRVMKEADRPVGKVTFKLEFEIYIFLLFT